MKKYYSIILLMFLSTLTYAQVDVIQTDSTEIVVENINIFKDSRLDVLDKRPALMVKVEEEKDRITNFKPIVSSDGKKKVTGSIYTTKGFRVVIYNGPDHQQAMTIKNTFSRAFPDQATFLSYNVPSYKIKVGNFESRNDASSFMRKIGKVFPTAFIVPDIITVKNINVSN